MIANQMVGGGKRKNRSKNDLYSTPPTMIHHLMKNESFYGEILEPCADDGAMAAVISEYMPIVRMMDIKPRNKLVVCRDFLTIPKTEKYQNIITNFPYTNSIKFIKKGLEVVNHKMALLFPIAYLHGLERFTEIYSKKMLETIYIFIRRPALDRPLNNQGKYHTGMQSYQWLVFNKKYFGNPTVKWINNQEDVISKPKPEKHPDQLKLRD